MRILLTGGSGAGKSTVGKGFSGCLAVPYFDVDSIAYADANWTKRPIHNRLEMVHDVATNDAWVAAAGHLIWTAELSQRADVILWLDPPLAVLLWRLTKRYLASRSTRRVDMAQLVRVHWIWSARWYFQRYRPDLDLDVDSNLSRSAVETCLWTYQDQTVRMRGRTKLQDIVRLLAQRGILDLGYRANVTQD